MASVSIRTQVRAPAPLLWDMIGRFNTLGQWHPLVRHSDTRGTGKGALRRLRMMSGGTLVERLEHISNAERVYLYSVLAGPLPVDHCVAELRVIDQGDGTSVVEWSSAFVASGAPERDAIKALKDVYTAGLQNVKRIYESLSSRTD
jgi:mxaD protein